MGVRLAEPVGDAELIIPIKWWRVLSRSLYSFGVVALLATGLVSYAVGEGAGAGVSVAIATTAGLLWVFGAWLIARDDLYTIRAGRLRLDSDGFTFGGHRWLWAEIAQLYVSREHDGEAATSCASPSSTARAVRRWRRVGHRSTRRTSGPETVSSSTF
ncbi:hypothetical protein JDV09_09730 [Mycobacterium sp. Y57]|uniref:hypothetical protein n=1 Tax=Mycolicibacterium xanthum TaxID=2796469 RepID=UPI001C858CBE|nr:hypothetical protein [Mycolicibacterium xanthum]MBX7432382.1 hypothetical protein [Mycolicibacterium xanthum]